MSRVAPTLAAPAPPEASPSDGGVEMEAPAPSPRFADAQAVDDERFVGDSSWWACLSEWFRSEQGDGPESFAQLRKEVRLLKRENAALRELARSRGATSDDVARACSILEPLTPAQAVATLYGDAEGGWAAAATSSGSVVSAGDSASGDVLVDGVPVAVAPNPLVVVSDAGRTVDDELALVLLRAFAERGLVQPTAVVANVSPALARARLVRGTLDTLGLYHVPVGVGTDGGGGEDCLDTWSETADQYVPGEQSQAAKALKGGDRTEDDSVWDLVVSFNMYDPLALMACVPDLRRRFFRCVEKRVDGVAHSVIGTSKDAPGVDEENVRPLRDFMYRGFFKGATLNFSSYTKLDADTMPTRLRDLAREVASVALDPTGKKAPDEVKDDADERKEPR